MSAQAADRQQVQLVCIRTIIHFSFSRKLSTLCSIICDVRQRVYVQCKQNARRENGAMLS